MGVLGGDSLRREHRTVITFIFCVRMVRIENKLMHLMPIKASKIKKQEKTMNTIYSTTKKIVASKAAM